MRRPRSSGSSAPPSSSSGSSSTSPPPSRALFRARVPSTSTAPSASSRSAAVREPTCGRSARKRSRRTPAASLGTSTRYLDGSDTARLTVGEQQRADQDGDARDDERVGEVERRPVAEVEEIGDVPEPHAIGEVRDAAAEEQAERDRQDGVAATGAGKKTSIQLTATAVRTITPAVAVGKRPKAIPEFWTWWIESGPTTSTASPRESVEETIAFVTWSGATAAAATAARATHWRGPAPSERPAPHCGTTPFVADPTRISEPGRPDSPTAPLSACNRCTRSPRASPRASRGGSGRHS